MDFCALQYNERTPRPDCFNDTNMRCAAQIIAATLAVAAISVAAERPTAVRGSSSAPITILVFSDFESFPCARSASVIDGLLQQTRDVRVIFKHAPAASNPNAMLAHEAALAAGAQGKLWKKRVSLN